jgi:type VI secretion system protein ImpG
MTQPVEAFLERELVFLEETARAFAERYPANAKHLVAEAGRSIDPHLERMIESFALLAGRVRYKVDSDFAELTQSLLQILYPHLNLIIPSLAIAQAHAPDEADLRQGWRLDKDSHVRSQAFGVRAETLQYRVGYPVTLWPIELKHVAWETSPFDVTLRPPAGAVAVLRIHLASKDGATLEELPLEKLRFYLSGERQLMAGLYEILFNRCLGVTYQRPDLGPDARTSRSPLRLRADECLFPVGLDLDEGLLPFPPESFLGHRLLMELLSFPQKFLFFDLGGWQQVRTKRFGTHVEVQLFFSQTQENLERGLSAENFQLGCTPVVNVFPQSAEPVDCHHRQTEYRVVPSRRQPSGLEVYRIDSMRTLDMDTAKLRDVLPFYASAFGATSSGPYYHVSRRDSLVEEVPGSEVYVSLVDPEFHPSRPSNCVLDIQTWCTNRHLPFKFQQAGDRLSLVGDRSDDGWLELLHKPTQSLRPFVRRGTYWRLIGQNALNHVSLIEGKDCLQALQELLCLCDFSSPLTPQLAAVNQQMIEGIRSVRSRPVMERVRSTPARVGMCRGTEVQIDFDEEKYTGTGVLLVASVLERFFALYTAVNSFTKLVARTTQAEGYLKKWPPRAGADLLP